MDVDRRRRQAALAHPQWTTDCGRCFVDGEGYSDYSGVPEIVQESE